MSRRLVVVWAVLVAMLAGIYTLSLARLGKQVRPKAKPELLVSLPRFAQVTLAGGDRHLAANLGGFRVLVAATERMGAEDYAVQARLQRDIAWFNPSHEDNYYIAAAILPWNGNLDATEYVLRQAVSARQFDWQPAFYLGFLYYHFMKNPAEGARWLLLGVPRATTPQDQWALQNVAVKWMEKGYSTGTAADMVGAMAASAPAGSFRKYLGMRATRLHDLARLRELAQNYRERHGRPLKKLDELVSSGLISEIPKDPLGFGFSLDAEGMPMLNWTTER